MDAHLNYINFLNQNLEFVAETRILAEMKIKNRGEKYFPWEKIDKHTFSYENQMMDLWMLIEVTNLTFIMNFSVLEFSNLPPKCLKLHSPNFPRGMPPDPIEISSFFFSLAIPASAKPKR